MAVELFKLIMTATASNNRVRPQPHRFFRKYNTAVDKAGANSIIIIASNFVDDNGTNVPSSALTKITASNGYYLLFVDGVLQQSNLYTVSSNNLSIKSGAASLHANAPITLIVNNFDPQLTVTVST